MDANHDLEARKGDAIQTSTVFVGAEAHWWTYGWIGYRDTPMRSTLSVPDSVEAAIRAESAAEVSRMREALERLRDNPFWTCDCTSRSESDQPWADDAVWPDPLTHDPRCTVQIAATALLDPAALASLQHQEEQR